MKISEKMLEKVETHREKIGQLLLKYTSLTQKQLDEALEIQKETGHLVGEILLRKNYIHPHDIIRVVCHQIEIPYLETVHVEEIDPSLIVDIPINYAKHHEVLPTEIKPDRLDVICTDPFNFEVLNDLQGFQKTVYVSVSPLRIADAINRVYEKANKNIVDSLEDEFDESLDLEGLDILDAGADEAPVIDLLTQLSFEP